MGKELLVSKFSLLQWIEDYHWMNETLREADQEMLQLPAAKGVQYGIEATMPKASGGTSDPVFFEVFRRTEYRSKTLREYKMKVLEIQKRIDKVQGDREREVLWRLLNGNSMKSVGNAMKLSSQTVSRIRERIVEMMLND